MLRCCTFDGMLCLSLFQVGFMYFSARLPDGRPVVFSSFKLIRQLARRMTTPYISVLQLFRQQLRPLIVTHGWQGLLAQLTWQDLLRAQVDQANPDGLPDLSWRIRRRGLMAQRTICCR